MIQSPYRIFDAEENPSAYWHTIPSPTRKLIVQATIMEFLGSKMYRSRGTPPTIASSAPEGGRYVSRVPAITSRIFQGFPANVSGVP